MATLAELNVNRAEFQTQIDEVSKLLSYDPELGAIHAQLVEELAKIDKEIEAKSRKSHGAGSPPADNVVSTDASPAPVPSTDSQTPVTTPVGNDATSKTAKPVAAKPVAVFNVNDKVTARWHEDKQFYPARIVSVTGSKADPVYTVMFDGYKDTETFRGHQLRELNSKKRKAENSGPPSPPKPMVPTSKPAGVISAAASVNPALVAEARKGAGKASDDAPPPAKVKKPNATQTYERKQGDWKSFSSKRKKGMKGMKSNGIFRPAGERTQPAVPDPKTASRKDLSRVRPRFDDPDAVET